MDKSKKPEELNCNVNAGSKDDTCEDNLLAANTEIEKLDNELEIAHKEIILQEDEIELQASELVAAYKELKIQNIAKEKQAAELIVTNKELQFQNDEKEKRAIELNNSNLELIRVDEHLKEHIHALEEMMFMLSHKVRQPIVNILGIANLFDMIKDLSEETKKLVAYNRESALALDLFTKELTTIMSDLKKLR